MHSWGDEWFEENEVEFDKVVSWFSINARRWGRLGGQIKEKFGTLRFYVTFHYQFHDLVHPGYVYSRWPKWLWVLDLKITGSYFYTPIRTLIHRYQTFVYKLLYKLAVKKWPHFKDEILCYADYPEFLM